MQYDWIELGIHGYKHSPVEELKKLTPEALLDSLDRLQPGYSKLFRPPGWYITREHIEVLNRLHIAVALHKRDEALARHCRHGYYMCEDRFPCWHGHTHNVCGNYLRAALPELLAKWGEDQEFAFVSEAVLVKV